MEQGFKLEPDADQHVVFLHYASGYKVWSPERGQQHPLGA